MHQIIMNLCTNAKQAMESSGGTITLELKNHKISSKSFDTGFLNPGNYILLIVADNGVGMNEETKKQIFDPFFTTKEEGKGSGLGLSVVHGIVKKHSGAIYVYSKENIGTEFHIYFPARSKKAVPSERDVEENIPLGTESILLIEDETEISASYKEIIELQGYTVQTMTNSESALKEVLDSPDKYNLIITDYSMPGLNGIDISKKIHVEIPSMPIILISGMIKLISKNDLEAAGISASIAKPVDFGQLFKSIRKILDGYHNQ